MITGAASTAKAAKIPDVDSIKTPASKTAKTPIELFELFTFTPPKQNADLVTKFYGEAEWRAKTAESAMHAMKITTESHESATHESAPERKKFFCLVNSAVTNLLRSRYKLLRRKNFDARIFAQILFCKGKAKAEICLRNQPFQAFTRREKFPKIF